MTARMYKPDFPRLAAILILCLILACCFFAVRDSFAEDAPSVQPMTGTVIAAETVEEPEESTEPEEAVSPEPEETTEATDEPEATNSPEPEETSSQEPTKTPKATASPTAVPVPTEIPQESESPYEITITVPSGWTNASSATVTIRFSDSGNLGWKKVEYRTEGAWKDISEKLSSGKTTVKVTDNGSITVRATDPHGHVFEETEDIECFDRSVPTAKAGISGGKLKVTASDSLSGVAGIQVNGLLFTTLDEGNLSVKLNEALKAYEHLAVRAFDYAGNFSDPVTLDNPYYEEESEATPTPDPTATLTPASASGSAAVYTQTATAVPQAEPTSTPVVEKEYITIGPGMPYQADGNSHTLDVLYSAATNKQFITLQTKSGNTFYLVIDYDKPIDEDAEMYETYFLNLVDERDLTSLMTDEEVEEIPTPTPQVVYVTPTPTTVPAQTTEEKTEDSGNQGALAGMAVLGILIACGAAAFVMLKGKTPAKKAKPESEFEFEDEDGEEQ